MGSAVAIIIMTQGNNSTNSVMLYVLFMACRDVWNTWHEGRRSPQNPTAKPEGFVATGGPRAMYFTHHGKPWIRPVITRPFCKSMTKNINIEQIKSTMTEIDDSNRWRKKIALGCSQEATAPLILFFKLFHWLNIERHLERMTYIHNQHSLRRTSIIW